MAQHNDLGREGETRSVLYLLQRDYHILECNWHGAACEIDIIAAHYGEIVFVEVKTRNFHDGTSPEEAVTSNRMYRMSRAAEEYLTTHWLQDYPFRFDIISILVKDEEWKLQHIKQAFFLKPKERMPFVEDV